MEDIDIGDCREQCSHDCQLQCAFGGAPLPPCEKPHERKRCQPVTHEHTFHSSSARITVLAQALALITDYPDTGTAVGMGTSQKTVGLSG